MHQDNEPAHHQCVYRFREGNKEWMGEGKGGVGWGCGLGVAGRVSGGGRGEGAEEVGGKGCWKVWMREAISLGPSRERQGKEEGGDERDEGCLLYLSHTYTHNHWKPIRRERKKG